VAVRCAVGVPNLEAFADPHALVDLARRAEAAGWDGFFLWDHLVYRDTGWPAADPWVAMAAVAAATQRLRLGVMVTPLARRRPWKLARETVTLDRLSGGRLVLGAGLGSSAEHEFVAFGEEGDDRVRARRLDEGLDVLAGLWTGAPFAYAGEELTVAETAFRPPPVQQPRIPVWIAGRWPARPPFRRAARWDGVFPIHSEVPPGETMTPEQLAEIVTFVRGERADDAPFDVAIEGLTAPGAAVREAYGAAGRTWWVEQLAPFRGPAAERVARVAAGPPG
jgi:alkanesulfonate monooxygenase SsuD/methylene tetrahydromethanopterin reductase-like flavin-dependent oxidoreductase (luciferase family)